MFENLSVFENRYEELNLKLYDPTVAADREQYAALMKEHKEITPIVEHYRALKKAEADAAGAQQLLDDPDSDKELRQMAAEELSAAREDAARIAEEFNRPAILFVKRGDMLKGSARTIETVNIYEALKSCSEYIEEFGGHAQAAGVNVRAENFELLKRAMDDYLGETYTQEDFAPVLHVCEEIDCKMDIGLVRELELLEPCGVGNKKPLFSLAAGGLSARRLKDGSPHIAIKTDALELVWFGGEKALPLLESDIPKRLVFECGISKFRGEESARGLVRDMVCGGELDESARL